MPSEPVKWVSNLKELIENDDSQSFKADLIVYLEDGYKKSERDSLQVTADDILPDKILLRLTFKNPLEVSQGEKPDYMLLTLDLEKLVDKTLREKYQF